VRVLGTVHDDERGVESLRAWRDDLGHFRPHAVEPVDLCSRAAGCGCRGAGPQKGGSEGLFVRTRDRGHSERVGKDPFDDAGCLQSGDLIAGHAARDRIPSAEHAE